VIYSVQANTTVISNLSLSPSLYTTIAESVRKVLPIMEEEQSRIQAAAALPRVISGSFTYGVNDSTAKPLRNAKVRISGYSTKSANILLPALTQNAVYVEYTTDGNGYFQIEMPANYTLPNQCVNITVTRGGVSQQVSVTRDALVETGGDIKTKMLKNAFSESEGIMEKLDNAVYSIGTVVDYEDKRAMEEANAQSQPQVTLGEGDNAFALTWFGSAITTHTYKLLFS